jgi:anaerobic carbon-monoxide dehydrogenase catalytic subunit
MTSPESRSIDPASQHMLKVTDENKIETAWDRLAQMQPQCGFGQLGLCCRHCSMGPCRIDPFSETEQTGVCGATADIIAARHIARMIASGVAAHGDHGRGTVEALLLTGTGDSKDYEIKDVPKLQALAADIGVETENREPLELARAVAERLYEEFGRQHGELTLLTQRAPEAMQKNWRERGLIPRGIDREVVELMDRTHMGVDNDARNIIRHGIKTALADGWGGSMIATELSDVLFRRPQPTRAECNLGVLKEDEVNIIVHGHEPTLSDIIVAAASDPEIVAECEKVGAKGVQLAGICCTANEILMRHGIPIAGNFLQQELAIATGVVEAMVVDVQCIMPALGKLTQQYHTKLITTSPRAKFPFAEHIEFEETRAYDIAKQILRKAIEGFPKRDPAKINIPKHTSDMVAGFTAENVFDFLGGHYRPSYRPLNDAIISGRLRGAAAVVGCNNPKIAQDSGHVAVTRELLRNDVLVVTTGCTAVANAKAGLMRPETADEVCGEGLREVCRAVGIPPVLHVGSCADISRILVILSNIVKEGGLGDKFADLPVAGAAPEWMSEKAVAIGFYVIGCGVFTVLGQPLPVLGAPDVTRFICDEVEQEVGGKFAFEADPVKSAHLMLDHIDSKRAALGLVPPMYEQPYASAQAQSSGAAAS